MYMMIKYGDNGRTKKGADDMATISWPEIRSRAIKFQHEWKDESKEHAEAKSFWDGFFHVFGIERRRVATFEKNVRTLNGQGFIDLLWKGTLLVEHKSRGKDLEKAYDQARDYFPGLTDAELPRYILVSDFEKFVLYDLEEDTRRAFNLENFHQHIELFSFMAGYEKQEIREQDPVNMKAAEEMGQLHDKLKDIGYTGHDLEVYLVRLVFCMFADDTGIFERNLFRDYILNETKSDGSDLAAHIDQLFDVLNTPEDNRLKNLNDSLTQFPYVNGNLFAERLRVASFDHEMRDIIIRCSELNWSLISPAIFGSLFQSVMNPEERRNLGAHYTSEENIMKVIKPLFLDDLYAEFEHLKQRKQQRELYLENFHQKLSELTFFDPACGCGNFLIIAYRELRLLELEVIREQLRGQLIASIDLYVKVNVDQFYGIEIEEFPSQIAQVAMWLIDHQMNIKVSEEFGDYFIRLPLRKKANIHFGNSLQLDWEDVIEKDKCSFILGNPPFIGYHLMNDVQKNELLQVSRNIKDAGMLDYVTAWFFKASEFMRDKSIKTAFVSTNSIVQGSQPLILWKALFTFGIDIFFAHQTFKWTNEAKGKAAVYCVIVGFSATTEKVKYLYTYPTLKSEPIVKAVTNINQYLLEAPTVFIEKRSKPISNVPSMTKGSQSTDGGNYLFTKEEMESFIKKEPNSQPYFRPFIGAKELVNSTSRYCLYLANCSPAELRKMPYVLELVENVKNFRLESKKLATRKWAEFPSRMTEDRTVDSDILIIPRVTSENRNIIPIGFYDASTICSDSAFQIPYADHFMFGILNSSMHMAWTTTVCGRLKGDYRYSNTIVYNNFVFPEPDERQKQRIEEQAKIILEIREKYLNSGSTLADLYDNVAMPADLRKAHQQLDQAVDKAYRGTKFVSDEERLEFLFSLYVQKVNKQ